jgi:DNA-binding transcriptional LysR family regulator
MELRHLRYFVAIAEEGSFTRAAERLWVAQPSLSSQIRRLESELGVQLFDRHTRGVEPTSAGQLFLERARKALSAADEALAIGRDLEAGVVGTVRLGLATEATWGGSRQLLDVFGRDRADVELTTFESYAGALLRDLGDGRLDAVLAPSRFGAAELFRRCLGQEPWLVLAGSAHPLAEGRGPVAAEELRGERIVVTGHRDGAAYDRAVADTLADLGVTTGLRRGGSGPALFSGVATGHELALTTSGQDLGGGVVARPLERGPHVDFALLWRDETPSPALVRLIEAASAMNDRPVLAAA